MGDAADYLTECMEDAEWSMDVDYLDSYPRLVYYLHLTDDELRKETARSRNKKIMGIRKWPNKLSDKQRYCLAVWLLQNDEKNYANLSSIS